MTAPIVRIENVGKHNGETVRIQGWLYNKRSSGKIRFLHLRDGSPGTLQAVVVPDVCEQESFDLSGNLTQESSVVVTGTVKEGRKPGEFEIDTKSIELVQMAHPDYPISLKDHGPEHLMQYRHLWLRVPRQVAIMRVRAKLNRIIRNFFDERDFVLMDAPMLTPNACEGTSELFETDYFDNKAYLTQSGQLYAEACAMAVGKTYTFGPTFRAEKSKTRKHLTEFWMIEPEVAFCNLNGVMDLAEEFVKYVVTNALKDCAKELEVLERDVDELKKIATSDFPRVSYEKSLEMLNENGFKLSWGDDFGAPEETKLGELFEGKPVFIHGFPKETKSFYFKIDENDDRLALGCDLIAPNGFGEIIGGSERESDYETLKSNIVNSGLKLEDYEWFLDLRRYGSCPHGGFGLGFERTVAWICDAPHIRETIPFPRLINYLRP